MQISVEFYYKERKRWYFFNESSKLMILAVHSTQQNVFLNLVHWKLFATIKEVFQIPPFHK